MTIVLSLDRVNPNESLQTFCMANKITQQLLDTHSHTHTHTHHTEIGSILISFTIYICRYIFGWHCSSWGHNKEHILRASRRENRFALLLCSTIESLKSLIGIGSIEEIHMYVCSDLYAYVPG